MIQSTVQHGRYVEVLGNESELFPMENLQRAKTIPAIWLAHGAEVCHFSHLLTASLTPATSPLLLPLALVSSGTTQNKANTNRIPPSQSQAVKSSLTKQKSCIQTRM